MNLFLTEDGVLKLGYYGLTTQAECYSIKKMECYGVRSFAPEVFKGEYDTKSDVWSFGIALVELMGIAPYSSSDPEILKHDMYKGYLSLYDVYAIKAVGLIDFLKKCFRKNRRKRWGVNELLNVSVMRWRMMSSIHS